jgi:hypothetical protein
MLKNLIEHFRTAPLAELKKELKDSGVRFVPNEQVLLKKLVEEIKGIECFSENYDILNYQKSLLNEILNEQLYSSEKRIKFNFAAEDNPCEKYSDFYGMNGLGA